MIKIIQLVTAQELIGDVVEHSNPDEAYYVISNAANIHMVPQQGGSFGIGMIPFMPYVEGSLKISKDKVVMVGDPTVEMRNNYSKMFGSGIEIANVMPR